MNRTNRIALLAALTLLVAAAGTVLATRSPQAAPRPAGTVADEAEALDADALARAVERLAERGIQTDAAALGAVADRYGLGGAVRLHAWAHATDMAVQDIADRRDGEGDAPIGWGRLAKELGVHPGIGWVMGNGHGDGNPPDPERKADD